MKFYNDFWESVFKRYKGGSAKAPPPPAPTPTPRQLDEDVAQKDRDRRRQRIAAVGRKGTILTEGQSLASGSNATILGRSSA